MLFDITYRRFGAAVGVSCAVFLVSMVQAAPVAKSAVLSRAATKTMDSAASAFIENKGQWDAQAHFLSRTNGLNLWVTDDGAVYDFNRFVRTPAGASRKRSGFIEGHVVRASFVNARPSAVSGEVELGGRYNYFIGNEPSRWATGARGFSNAIAAQPYNGISIRYGIDQGSARYDVIVAPGADPSQVGLKLDGADGLQILPNGNLLIKTSIGVIEERGLTAYQNTASGLTQVPCHMVLDANVVHFDMGSYDTGKPLIIDPLLYSTFLGGSTPGDSPNGVAVDAIDGVYVVGQALSANFPTTTGAYKTKDTDASGIGFVTKMNEAESALTYSTFIGGAGTGAGGDSVVGVAVDKTYNAYITGYTYSSTFPTTTGALQTTNKEIANGGPNGFVTKLNPTGTALLYSTYLGGSGTGGNGDMPTAIAIDSLLDAYVVGGTYSTNFPTTAAGYQKTNLEAANTGEAGFVAKLNPTGTALTFCTYLAGSGDGSGDGEVANAVALDASDDVYVAGTTYSKNFPVSVGAFQVANNGFVNGVSTGFVSKLAPAGNALTFSTFLGGSNGDVVNGIAVDTSLNVTVVGSTLSTDFPVTPTALMVWNPETNSNSSTPACAFATKLASTGKTLVYSTYLGGSGGLDTAASVKLDGSGNAIIVGSTGSSDFPVTAGAFETVDQAINGAPTTGFLTRLAAAGTSLLYSTFLGGSGTGPDYGDQCNAVALTTGGYAVIAGITSSTDFPITSGAYDKQFTSGFVSDIEMTTAAVGIANMTLSPASSPGGTQCYGTITLTNSTTADTNFKLTATGPAVMPASVTIPQGQTTGEFIFLSEGVNVNTTVSITATSGALTKTATMTVTPPTVLTGALILSQTDVLGGSSVGATLNLNGFAGSPYTTVSLASNDSAAASVESSIQIPYNSSFARTTIKTAPVSTGVTVTITATLGTAKATATLQVRTARVALLTIPAAVVGGATVQGKILLSAPAGPLGDVVSLSTTTADAGVPTAVTVPAGTTSVTFNIITKAVTANVSATIQASYSGNSKMATIVVEK